MWTRIISCGFGLLVAGTVVADDETKITDTNTRFHRLYVLGNGNNAREDAAFLDDKSELQTAIEGPGRQAAGSTSSTLFKPTFAQLQSALTNVFNTAVAGDEITLYFSGHGGGGASSGIPNNPAEGGEPDSHDEQFRLRPGHKFSDDQFRTLTSALPAGVTLLAIFDSCFGGGFTGGVGDITESDRVRVIGSKDRTPTDPPIGWFVDTLTEDIVEKVNAGGTISGSSVEDYLTGEGWDISAPTNGSKPNSGKSKCANPDGTPCDGLPDFTRLAFAASDLLLVSGEDFSPISEISFELITENQDRVPLGTVFTDGVGQFPQTSLIVPGQFVGEEFLLLATDGFDLNNWEIVPEPGAVFFATLGLIVAGLGRAGRPAAMYGQPGGTAPSR